MLAYNPPAVCGVRRWPQGAQLYPQTAHCKGARAECGLLWWRHGGDGRFGQSDGRLGAVDGAGPNRRPGGLSPSAHRDHALCPIDRGQVPPATRGRRRRRAGRSAVDPRDPPDLRPGAAVRSLARHDRDPAGARPIGPLGPPLVRALAWLLLGGLLIAAITAIEGVRPGLVAAFGDPRFALGRAAALATAVTAAAAAFAVSVPDRSLRWLWLP